MKNDTETTRVFEISEDLKELSRSNGFGVLREKFWNKIFELNDLCSYDFSKATKYELQAFQVSVKTLVDFWREIDGLIDQSKTNQELMSDMRSFRRTEDYIVNLEE